jgi:hypothetical protein
LLFVPFTAGSLIKGFSITDNLHQLRFCTRQKLFYGTSLASRCCMLRSYIRQQGPTEWNTSIKNCLYFPLVFAVTRLPDSGGM